MRTAVRVGVILLVAIGSPAVLLAEADSTGNTDGVLTWQMDTLPPGKSARRQGLTCPNGGQLSRFGYYLHYRDGAARRAGTPITSRLVELASGGGHYDVKLDSTTLRQLIGWVDANCPYRGDEEIRAIADPDFPGIETLPVRPRTKTAPLVERP